MSNNNIRHYRIKTLSHCFFECNYHIVWTVKYRGKIFKQQYIRNEVKRIIEAVCKWKGFEVIELSVQEEHVHLCVAIEPKYSISYAMSNIKGKSSKWIKKKNKKIRGLCYKGSLWSRGYFVSTIGIDQKVIERYVRHQEKHNRIPQPTLWDTIKT